jgi:hypothetical protein
MRGHDPKHDYDDQEKQDVQDHQAVLDQCPDWCTPNVHDEEDQYHGEDEQGSLPSCGLVVWVVDYEKCLDNRSSEEGPGSISCLP